MLRIGVVCTNGGRRPPMPPPRIAGNVAVIAARAPCSPSPAPTPQSAQPNTAPPVQYPPQTALPAPATARKNPTSPSAPSSAAISSPPSDTPPTAPTNGNPQSMTLLGELYANGLGVPQRRRQSRRLVQARRRARRQRTPCSRSRMFALARPRRPARPRAKRQMARRRRQTRPCRSRLRSRAPLHRGPVVPAGFQARRRTSARRRRRRQPAGAICARHLLQGRPRRARKDMHEAVKLWAAAALADDTDAQVEYAIALYNGDGVARDEDAAAAIFHKAARARQPDRAGPLRPHSRQRARRPARSGRRREMAPRLARRRRDRHHARRFHGQPDPGDGGGRHQRGAAVARCDQAGASRAGASRGASAWPGAAIAGRAGEAMTASCERSEAIQRNMSPLPLAGEGQGCGSVAWMERLKGLFNFRLCVIRWSPYTVPPGGFRHRPSGA